MITLDGEEATYSKLALVKTAMEAEWKAAIIAHTRNINSSKYCD